MDSLDSPQRATQAEPDNMEWATYRVGVRFSSLIGDENKSIDKSTKTKHWTLVFTPTLYPVVIRTVEIIPNIDGNIAIANDEHPNQILSVPIAEYTGLEEDIEKILEAHPMRGTKYSPCFNNCQHFVASFLLLLEAFVYNQPRRCFQIINRVRMQEVLDVLTSEGMRLYNKPNIVLQVAQLSHLTLSGGVAIGLAQAAEATVAYTVPASGIAGWFGLTTSVVAPAAYAPVAAAIVPVAAIATVGTGATYLWQSKSWKDKSMFNNPRYHGFPIGPLRPLMPIERVREEDRANKDQAMFFSRAIGRIPIVKGVPVAGQDSSTEESSESCQCRLCRRHTCTCPLICVCSEEFASEMPHCQRE
ncbi:hypothetical protein CPB86DRAFT_553851 [Serendipita vermifera]|nr:hypothetical protein CPB86DRAFT_553851 [Serendipita vermifera]